MWKRLGTKQAAWGEAIVFMAIGGLATYVKPEIGVPILLVLLIIGVYLICRAYRQEPSGEEISTSIKSKPSQKQNCDRLATLYINYYNQFNNLIDEIAGSPLEDYEKFLQNNEILTRYRVSRKGKVKSIEDAFIQHGLARFKHPMLENRKTEKMRSLVAKMLKLANTINPDLHRKIGQSVIRLDIFGFFVLIGRFRVKYPNPQLDAELSKWGISRQPRLIESESMLRGECERMLKVISRYKSWWGWLNG